MKKLTILAIGLLFVSEAFASKARLDALQGAEFLKDTQTIFKNPAHVHSLGQYLTFEFGQTGATTPAARAEGGFLKKEGDAKFGAYLGHENQDQDMLRNKGGFLVESNPVEVFYGKNNWAGSVYFSNDKKKTTDEKQTTLGGRIGFINNNIQYYGSLDLIATADKASDDYKTLPFLNVGVDIDSSRFYYYGKLKFADGEQKKAGVKGDINDIGGEVGILDRGLSTKGSTIYYGASLKYDQLKIAKKITSFYLPVVLGIEYDLNDWSIVRASVTQNVLLGFTKDETVAAPGNKQDTIANNTTVSAGLGFKYKGFVLDGVLAASTTGDVNGSSFLSKAALTYNF